MFVCTHVLSLVDRNTTGAGGREENVLGTEAQVVVFKLGSPVIGEGVFQTNTDQQTIQRGAALSGSAKVAADVTNAEFQSNLPATHPALP